MTARHVGVCPIPPAVGCRCHRRWQVLTDGARLAGSAKRPGLRRGVVDRLAGDVPELGGMAGTLRRWGAQIVAWHATGVSNGPTEAVILWSGPRRVFDVVDGAWARGGHVLWSVSSRSTMSRAA